MFDINVKSVDADIDEEIPPGMKPCEAVEYLAVKKAESVAEEYDDEIIVAADTVVVYDTRIITKPADEQNAVEILALLSGQTHSVFTGVCVMRGDEKHSFYKETQVKMRRISDDEIDRYIETGEPMDKAGAYGIQSLGAAFIESIDGDYYNVMGLPVCALSQMLKEKFDYEII